ATERNGPLHPRPLAALLARRALPQPRRVRLQGRRRRGGSRAARRALGGRPPRGGVTTRVRPPQDGAAVRVRGPPPGGGHGHGESPGALGATRAPAARSAV
ncbi:MAG: hypothetical protein AVDCRST_MAG22-3496, partial [uncultured Rubrobacteraceae bacterium]